MPGTELSLGKRLFFGALLASLAVTAGLAIVVLLSGDQNETSVQILLTTALVSLFSLFALPSGVLLDQDRYRWLAWVGLTISFAAFAVAFALVWAVWDDDGSDAVWKTLAVLASFAAAVSQTAMTTSRRRPGDTPAVQLLWATSVGLAVLAAGMVSLAAVKEIDADDFYRALGAIVVADVFLVVAQSVVRRMSGAQALPAHALLLALDRPAGALPAGFRATGDVVEADVTGADFAAAVATAIRALERDGARVERVERRA